MHAAPSKHPSRSDPQRSSSRQVTQRPAPSHRGLSGGHASSSFVPSALHPTPRRDVLARGRTRWSNTNAAALAERRLGRARLNRRWRVTPADQRVSPSRHVGSHAARASIERSARHPATSKTPIKRAIGGRALPSVLPRPRAPGLTTRTLARRFRAQPPPSASSGKRARTLPARSGRRCRRPLPRRRIPSRGHPSRQHRHHSDPQRIRHQRADRHRERARRGRGRTRRERHRSLRTT